MWPPPLAWARPFVPRRRTRRRAMGNTLLRTTRRRCAVNAGGRGQTWVFAGRGGARQRHPCRTRWPPQSMPARSPRDIARAGGALPNGSACATRARCRPWASLSGAAARQERGLRRLGQEPRRRRRARRGPGRTIPARGVPARHRGLSDSPDTWISCHLASKVLPLAGARRTFACDIRHALGLPSAARERIPNSCLTMRTSGRRLHRHERAAPGPRLGHERAGVHHKRVHRGLRILLPAVRWP